MVYYIKYKHVLKMGKLYGKYLMSLVVKFAFFVLINKDKKINSIALTTSLN